MLEEEAERFHVQVAAAREMATTIETMDLQWNDFERTVAEFPGDANWTEYVRYRVARQMFAKFHVDGSGRDVHEWTETEPEPIRKFVRLVTHGLLYVGSEYKSTYLHFVEEAYRERAAAVYDRAIQFPSKRRKIADGMPTVRDLLPEGSSGETPDCVDCGKYFGYLAGRCSQCDQLHRNPLPIYRFTRGTRAMTDEQLEVWGRDGIHDQIEDATCCVCQQDHMMVVSAYMCDCNAMVCRDCHPALKNCPTCRAAKYIGLTTDELRSLVTGKKWKSTVGNIMRREGLHELQVRQLVCRAAELDTVIREEQMESKNPNSWYCLAVDFWKTKHPSSAAIRCYKQYFDGGDYVTSYLNICKYRVTGDADHLMKITYNS